jgi:hypothetical protein
MASPATTTFEIARSRARIVTALTQDGRIRPVSRDDARLFLHIALAIYVAGWEAYVERLIGSFFAEILDTQIGKFVALHTALSGLAATAAERFNTPNSDNTRNLLLQYTGYDPINDWVWPRRRMSGLQVRERLDQTLKVRHSFAHAFSMPSYSWNTSETGDVRLTVGSIRDTEAFFDNLITQTDMGMSRHIKGNYNSNLNW